MTTAIFAVYPIAVVVTLPLFGKLSDPLGRRAAMLCGHGASLLGVLCFAIANDPPWLFGGCAMVGIGVGLSVSPSTAAPVVSGIVAITAKPLPARVNIVAGGVASTPGMGLPMFARDRRGVERGPCRSAARRVDAAVAGPFGRRRRPVAGGFGRRRQPTCLPKWYSERSSAVAAALALYEPRSSQLKP